MNETPRAAFTSLTDQPHLPFLGSVERLVVTGEQAGGEFALVTSSGNRGHTAPRHRHLDAAETFVVLDGAILVEVGDERRGVEAGGAAVLPRLVPHTFVVTSATATWMTVHTPAGFDRFVRAVAETSGGAPADRKLLTRIAAEHGIEILGAGITLEPPG